MLTIDHFYNISWWIYFISYNYFNTCISTWVQRSLHTQTIINISMHAKLLYVNGEKKNPNFNNSYHMNYLINQINFLYQNYTIPWMNCKQKIKEPKKKSQKQKNNTQLHVCVLTWDSDKCLLNHKQQWLNYKTGMQMNLWTVVSRGQSRAAADSLSPLSKSCSTFQHCASASLSEKTFSWFVVQGTCPSFGLQSRKQTT